jgi:hypothetical protein
LEWPSSSFGPLREKTPPFLGGFIKTWEIKIELSSSSIRHYRLLEGEIYSSLVRIQEIVALRSPVGGPEECNEEKEMRGCIEFDIS